MQLVTKHETMVTGTKQAIQLTIKRPMGRHQSLDSHVKKNLQWLKALPGVTKVVIGISECCRHRFPPGHLRFKLDVEGGIKLNAYSGNGVTDLFIKIDPIDTRDAVKEALAKRFNR